MSLRKKRAVTGRCSGGGAEDAAGDKDQKTKETKISGMWKCRVFASASDLNCFFKLMFVGLFHPSKSLYWQIAEAFSQTGSNTAVVHMGKAAYSTLAPPLLFLC